MSVERDHIPYTTGAMTVADNKEDMLEEFAQWLEAKKRSESQAAADEDFDVEIFDESGKGVRTRRSHAKPFLQQLGLDLDPDPGESVGVIDDKEKPKSPVKRQSTGPQSTRVSAKYFKPAATK